MKTQASYKMMTIQIWAGLNIDVIVVLVESEIVNYLAYKYSAWHHDCGDTRSGLYILIGVSQSYQEGLDEPGPPLLVVLISISTPHT